MRSEEDCEATLTRPGKRFIVTRVTWFLGSSQWYHLLLRRENFVTRKLVVFLWETKKSNLFVIHKRSCCHRVILWLPITALSSISGLERPSSWVNLLLHLGVEDLIDFVSERGYEILIPQAINVSQDLLLFMSSCSSRITCIVCLD